MWRRHVVAKLFSCSQTISHLFPPSFLFRTQTSWVRQACWAAVWSVSPQWWDPVETTAASSATYPWAWSWSSSCSTTWSPGSNADARSWSWRGTELVDSDVVSDRFKSPPAQGEAFYSAPKWQDKQEVDRKYFGKSLMWSAGGGGMVVARSTGSGHGYCVCEGPNTLEAVNKHMSGHWGFLLSTTFVLFLLQPGGKHHRWVWLADEAVNQDKFAPRCFRCVQFQTTQ